MAKSVIKKLNRQTKPTPAPLSTKADRYAADWDDPAVQIARVRTRAQTPTWIGPGNPGIERKR